MKVSIGISNRHIHLNEEDFKTLFGDDYKLEKLKDLHQIGQFSTTTLLTIKTDKNQIDNVRVIGPIRKYTQVEISKTDAYFLGINPPIRDSGDIDGSSPITIIGPKGTLNLKEGCIIATRHIHILPEQLKMYGLEGKDIVNVRLYGEKGGIITNVHVKVSDDAYFELHLDTDDANAHMIKNDDIGEII